MSADEVLVDVLRAQLAAQPWWRTSANTVTSAVTLGVNAGWLLVSFGVDVDPMVIAVVAALVQLLGVVGVKLTPNGVTARQIDELEAYVGRHRA